MSLIDLFRPMTDPLLLRRLGAIESKLDGVERQGIKLERIVRKILQTLEEHMANPVIDRLVQEVQETRGAIDSAIVFIQGVPDLVRQAVEEALAANPGADLSQLTALADELDASQGDLTAALTANSEGEGEEPTEEPAPFPEPAG